MTTNRQPHEQCDGCGFEWDKVLASELVARLDAVGAQLRTVMMSAHPQLLVRPEPDVWSPVEYGAHIRDVMLNLRDRIVVGVAEDNPTPKPMYGAVRLASGLYSHDTSERLADEIRLACDLMGRTVTTFMSDLGRPIFYPWPRPATRTLRWVAAQALHEAEHHLGDVRRQLHVDRSS